MARKQIVELLDDIDGSEASTTVHFAVDGIEYEIDLNEKNVKKFNSAMATYVGHARKVSTRRRTAAGKASDSAFDPKAVREWAAAQGIDINARGRIPGPIAESYLAAVGG